MKRINAEFKMFDDSIELLMKYVSNDMKHGISTHDVGHDKQYFAKDRHSAECLLRELQEFDKTTYHHSYMPTADNILRDLKDDYDEMRKGADMLIGYVHRIEEQAALIHKLMNMCEATYDDEDGSHSIKELGHLD